ncbi:DUF1080 domain-containing protein [Hyunsoonleella pacifica]|uniref:DUF1080 domain-containing protein n=1 Tax=Hyunsoonleella pacifica TaxID=1080224 RepID=A0A4V2JAU4_9FLAO|nr:DUF1080 domain-containing protein [Hyunsoonleella pacifica]
MFLKRILPLLLLLLAISSCNYLLEDKSEKLAKEKALNKEEPKTPEETELYKPVPPTVSPTGQNGVPSDAIVLFDGSNFEAWEHVKDSSAVQWILNEDGSMTVKDKSGDIQTKQQFGSVQLHIEWKSPEDIRGNGQHRANSGVFLQGQYEVQILDNNNNDTYVNGQVGAIYKQSIPLVKASVASGDWNTYDIIFHAPRFNDLGRVIKEATITVLHNGVLIQDNFEIQGAVAHVGFPKYNPHGKLPLMLQDHGDNSRVSYRNIWIRALD